jgi:hypothetical protein
MSTAEQVNLRAFLTSTLDGGAVALPLGKQPMVAIG